MLSRRDLRVIGGIGTLLWGSQFSGAIDVTVSDNNSLKQAAANAAYGMVTYYKGNETGMIPGELVPPNYWWEAGAMFGQLIEYWSLTGDSTYNDIVSQGLLFQVGPNKDYMPPNQTKDEGNDDQVFWAFAAMSAAELNFPDPPPDQPSWLALAQAVFNLQTTRWDTTKCNGGLRWQIFPLNPGYDYKNTISTGGYFQLAARLARYTGNATYAEWAEKSWDWLQASPLITPTFQVWDGTSMDNDCANAAQTYWTYNVGTLLMGASYMFNYTNGNSTWGSRVTGLLSGSDVFFVQSADQNTPPQNPKGGGKIMAEVACEFPAKQTCDYDQPSFKAYLSRWMAVTTQMAPNTTGQIMPLLQASAEGAAGQCTGQPGGNTCGRRWYQTTWDGMMGVGEQMAAMSVFQNNLIGNAAPPVTAVKGGTSKGDPSAGGAGDGGSTTSPVYVHPVSTSDKAGAAILTALALILLLGASYWIMF